jgi:hypothetical protein
VSRRIRIELDQEGARALHAALTATLAADAVDADQIAAARGVLDQLDRRVPDWVADDPSQAVLAALADAEAQGRGALAEEELVAALGAGGTSIRPVLDRMVKERLVQRTERDGRVWLAAGRRRPATQAEPVTEPDALVDLIYAEHRPGRWAHRPSVQAIGRLDDPGFEALAGALRSRGLLEPAEADQLALTDEGAALARERWAAISPTPHWRIPAPPLPYRSLPVQLQPSDQACPSEACDGRATWLKAGGRTATWRALTRDGSVEWTCPSCSRTWLVYLQACTHDGAPAYRDPVDGDHNRPYWRSGR